MFVTKFGGHRSKLELEPNMANHATVTQMLPEERKNPKETGQDGVRPSCNKCGHIALYNYAVHVFLN